MGQQQPQSNRLDPLSSARTGERGFTIIEVLIAALVFSLCAFAMFSTVRQAAAAAAAGAASAEGNGNLEQLAAALSSDASTALAVYAPADDACSGIAGTTIAIFYKDNGGLEQTITYQDNGGSITRTSSAAATTSTFTGMTLSAQCIDATALAVQEGLGPNLPGITVHDYPVNFGTNAQTGSEQTGGNRVIVAQIAQTGTADARTLHLLAGTVPTGFTIVGPQWHVVVYRLDHTRRFLFGLGQISWLQIMADVEVSYDDWQTHMPWCPPYEALEVYGAQPRFNEDDVPVYVGATDADAPTRHVVGDLYPETLLQYCRTMYPDPPGSLGGASFSPAPLPTPDDQVVAIPPWWVWQNCGPSMTCPPGTTPPVACDPLTPGSCTVTVPAVPPPGWTAWCAAYSPPVWGSPQFGAPCAAPTPPPSPPPAPTAPPSPPTFTDTFSGTWSIAVDGSGVVTTSGGWVAAGPDTSDGINIILNSATGTINISWSWSLGGDADPCGQMMSLTDLNTGNTFPVNGNNVTVVGDGPGPYHVNLPLYDGSDCSEGPLSFSGSLTWFDQ
jgi:prepilin-type N-terminal cleavage/methylation domain-containing protein